MWIDRSPLISPGGLRQRPVLFLQPLRAEQMSWSPFSTHVSNVAPRFVNRGNQGRDEMFQCLETLSLSQSENQETKLSAKLLPVGFHLKNIIQTDHTQLSDLTSEIGIYERNGAWEYYHDGYRSCCFWRQIFIFMKIAKLRTVECWAPPYVYRVNRFETLTNAVSFFFWGSGCLPPAASIK